MKITKEDLKNLIADRMKVRDLKQQIQDIEEAAAIAACQYSMTSGSKSPYHDVMADKVSKLIECKNEYMEAQLQYAEQNRTVLIAIRQLQEPYYSVIHKRYVENQSWMQIARSLNYCESAVRKIHAKALILLQTGD